MKTLNVLLDGNARCKVTDFGLSQSDDLNTAATMATAAGNHAKGTPAYMAPELLAENIFSEKADVYAYAIIVWEVLTGGWPWQGLNPMQVGMQILMQKARPAIPENAPADLASLMTRCWAHEAGERPTFAEVKAELVPARGGPLSPSASASAL